MDYPISVPSIGLVGGKFADEDPLAGTPGSLIPAQWGNAVTDEIRHVILESGLTPDEAVNTQLATAISLIIGEARPLASQIEAETGTDNNKMMTPLRTVQSFLKRLATHAQVNAGTDDATFVTPKKLRFGFSMVLAATGYITFPSWLGGVIFQWGQIPTAATGIGSAMFPLVFPTNAFAVQVTDITSGGIGTADIWGVSNLTTTGFSGYSKTDNGAGVTTAAYYLAIGN